MRLAVLTSLYPSRSRPFEGLFAERRWLGMAARGHAVRVVHPVPRTPWPFVFGSWRELATVPRHEERGGIPITAPRYLHVPRAARPNARRFAAIGVETILAGDRPDAVVCDYAWPASAAAPALAREGMACVVSGRGSDVLEVAGEAGLSAELAANLRAAGHWCAVSEHLVVTMDRLGGGSGTLVPNGVDLELFRPREASAARSELGLPGGGPLVLVVGHLIPRKDPLLALAAFEAGAPADARLVFVGTGPLHDELELEVARRGLAGRVELAGSQPPERLALWYAAADLLLLTSRREGRPNVVLEALASGRPVLATEAGGTGELLEGLDGMLSSGTDARDPAALGTRLGGLLTRDHDPASLRARVEPLSWERSLDALEGCLERAIADRRDGGAAR